MKTCETCGGPINRGGVASARNRRCLACRVAAVMPRPTECVCGCGRPAGYHLRGLSQACYSRLMRRGGVALLDRLFPLEARRG